MKKPTLIALFVADAAMFLAVMSIIAAAAAQDRPMAPAVAWACAAMVLGSMGMLLLAYLKALKGGFEETVLEKIKGNFRIVDEELRAQKILIAQQEKNDVKITEDAAKIRGLAAENAMGVSQLNARLEALECALKKCGRAEEKASRAMEEIDALKETQSSNNSDFDGIVAKLSVLEKGAETLSAQKDGILASIEASNRRIAALEEVSEQIASELKNAAQSATDALGGQITAIEDETLDGFSQKEHPLPATPPENSDIKNIPELGHLMAKALSGASTTKDSVAKFIEKADTPAQTPAQEDPLPETAPQNAEITASETDTDSPKNAGENTAQAAPAIDESSAADTPQAQPSADAEENASAAEQNPVAELSAAEEQNAPADAASQASGKPSQDMLFEELPENRKPQKPKKGDTSLTVNALIGIGNKPFLRGNGAGLNPDKGVPMEYVEIGKWRFVFGETETPVEFEVLKNDETPPAGETKFTINPGEKMGLNLIFPAQQD